LIRTDRTNKSVDQWRAFSVERGSLWLEQRSEEERIVIEFEGA
jgi:hypothetical protein